MTQPSWVPSAQRIAASRLTAFRRFLSERMGESFSAYPDLHRFSVSRMDAFWTALWDFAGVRGERGGRVLADFPRMPGTRFFPDGRLNLVENLLRRPDDRVAVVSATEAGPGRTLTFADLDREVRQAAAALRAEGVQPGDRVAGFMANVPEALVAALATAALGAVWSSCSPDFGVQGVLDRFGQIGPAVLIGVDGYRYGGTRYDCRSKLEQIVACLPSVRRAVVVPLLGDSAVSSHGRMIAWSEWMAAAPALEGPFERFPFNHPLYILYSSGTTGVPKCIVHGAGGTLIQHLKEHQLHCDIRAGDRVFYFTTCGWMMWNWLISVLASEAAIVLYDGSPFHPDEHRLFDLAERAGVTLFGTSAKYLDALRKADLTPRASHDLSSVRTITSTGSPLAAETFDYVFERVKTDVHLASISGGTDIVGLFVGGDPTAPVWRGEIQAACLGMDMDVFDETGRPVAAPAPGELVCKAPFPTMPLGFWNDEDERKYRAAYFERFPGVWTHGDWAAFTEHGGIVIYGRSDATLNPGGIRIGTAEIYRQVEQLPEVVESLATGQQWGGDERIVLFVRLRQGVVLDDALRKAIRQRIRANVSPHHVPARILQVTDLPRTKSGKLVELAVRDVIHAREVKNREALANPEALEQFRNRPELQS